MAYFHEAVSNKELDLNLFDFGRRHGISKRQILEISSNFIWIDKAFNILFLGDSGLGKSFLASFLGYKAMEAGYNVIFSSMIKRIRTCDLFILDEVGSAILDRQEANKVFQLIYDFYHKHLSS